VIREERTTMPREILFDIDARRFVKDVHVNCGVVPAPNELLGFTFVAYAIATEGDTKRELLAHCRFQILYNYARPSNTATGKLDYEH